jgi:phage baseplate assembly protein W
MSNKYSSYKQFLEENTKKNSNLSDRDRFRFADKSSKKLNGLFGIAPALPLTFSKEGPYSLFTELRDLVKQNFMNLVLTEPGERIMDVTFGVGLKKYLFENVTESLQQEIAQNIIEQKSRYMPYLNIDNIEIENDSEEPNYLLVSVYYSIPSLSIEDTLSVAIGE